MKKIYSCRIDDDKERNRKELQLILSQYCQTSMSFRILRWAKNHTIFSKGNQPREKEMMKMMKMMMMMIRNTNKIIEKDLLTFIYALMIAEWC